MDDIVFLYLAYSVIWIGLFLYIFKIYLDQRRMSREIKVLKEVVDGAGKRGKEDL